MQKTIEWGQVWPSRAEFRELAKTRRVIPVATKILLDGASPVTIYRTLADSKPGTFILESAERDGTWSRWSFIGVSSRASLVMRGGHAHWIGDVPEGIELEGSTLDVLRSALNELASEPVAGLPPLTGGLVGALGWDVLYDWEPTLRHEAPVEHTTPDVSMALCDDLVVVDHKDSAVWLIANAINRNNTAQGVDEAWASALERLDAMRAKLSEPVSLNPAERVDVPLAEPQMRTSKPVFEANVERAKEAIRDGEVFQVVLSQRADVDSAADPIDIYRMLRAINPSPYMYYLQLADDENPEGFAMVGSSPETLLKAQDGRAMTFPIAGSRPRGADPLEDHELAQELLKDPKEISEHVMLVDLSRNDLAKICEPGTVEVSEMMSIKKFSHIMHITSTVTGKLRDDVTGIDALAATFPAGTLSGAPKPRAIEIIDELEPARRGLYGGVVGYFDFSGNSDLAIAIRTAIISRGRASVQAGAGIVADSVPETEYIETTNKAAAALRAVQLAEALRPPAPIETESWFGPVSG